MRPHLAPPPRAPIQPGPVPSFSVIIAAYNAAETVGDAVASALEQTLPPMEVIVCDDGSRDDTAGALEPFAGRIEVLRQENRGEAGAKNTAARAASGEFVAILDADDVYLPERLEALGELAAARPDLDILTTDAVLTVGGRPVRTAYDESWTFEVDDQRRAILVRNFVFGHAAVRRELLLANMGFDEAIRWTTDWDCWLRLIMGGSRVGLVALPLAEYRLHDAALSANRPEMIAGRVATLEKALANAERLGLSVSEREVLARSVASQRREATVSAARRAVLSGDPTARRRSLAIAFGRRHAAGTRVKAALSALAPRLARRRMLARDRGTWVGAAGVRVRSGASPASDPTVAPGRDR